MTIMAAPITMASEDNTAQNNALLMPGLTSVSISLPPVAMVSFTPYNAGGPDISTPQPVDFLRAKRE